MKHQEELRSNLYLDTLEESAWDGQCWSIEGSFDQQGGKEPLLMEKDDIQKWATLLKSVPEFRKSRITEIKEEIEKGTYLTEEKLEIAITKLLEDVIVF